MAFTESIISDVIVPRFHVKALVLKKNFSKGESSKVLAVKPIAIEIGDSHAETDFSVYAGKQSEMFGVGRRGG